MAKKKKDKDVQSEIRDSARKIWLAGLGALSVAEEEGSKLFNTLAKKGERFDGTLRGEVEKASSRVKKEAARARQTAESTWTRIGGQVDEQVSAALHRIGVPSRSEIAKLSRKVEALTKALEEMASGKTARKKTTRKKTQKKTAKKTRA